MSGRVRALIGISWVVSLALAGCAPSATTPAVEAKSAEEVSGDAVSSNGERCLIRLNADRDVTEVFSEVDGYALLLPGTQWALRCEDDVPLIGSAGLLRLSVRHGEPSDVPLEERLRAIHQRFGSSLGEMGLEATPPVFAKVGTEDKELEKLVMTYEVRGGEIDESQTKSVHAWSAIRTLDGRVLEYHVSWTGSQGAWRDGMLVALRKMLLPFLPLSDGA
jgi:hypothetical protein